MPHVALEARRPCRVVGGDGHAGHNQPQFACLDDGVEGVAVLAEEGEPQSCLPRVGAKTADGIGDGRATDPAHDAISPMVKQLFERRKVGNFLHLAVANHQIRLFAQDGGDQIHNGGGGVLVVAIGVDDDVCPEAQARF